MKSCARTLANARFKTLLQNDNRESDLVKNPFKQKGIKIDAKTEYEGISQEYAYLTKDSVLKIKTGN